jgi:hypothetical protein
MGAMKIAEWPKYKKTGSPTEKKRRQIRLVVDRIFAEILPLSDGGKQGGATTKLPQASVSGQQRRP